MEIRKHGDYDQKLKALIVSKALEKAEIACFSCICLDNNFVAEMSPHISLV